MKTKIIFLLLVFSFGYSSFSQARIGSSLADIQNEFSDAKYELKTYSKDNGSKEVIIQHEFGKVTYVFHENRCIFTTIMPKTQKYLNYYVENLNDTAVRINDKEWKLYTNNGGILSIRLLFFEETGPVFWWQEKTD